MQPNPAMQHGGDWLWIALSTSRSIGLLALLTACIAGGLFCLLLMRGLRRAATPAEPRQASAPLLDERGTATIEFALVLPIAMFIALTLTQTTLVMGGYLYVNYAAFAATRTAIVQVPADYTDISGEGANVFVNAPGSEKFERIRRAAVFSLVPVSGRLESSPSRGRVDPAAYAQAIAAFYQAYGRDEPQWNKTLIPGRVRYADAHTTISVMETLVESPTSVRFSDLPPGSYTFGPKDPVTVRVEHDFNLSVPYVRGIFADGDVQTQDGPGQYTLITAQYTLTNEGIDDQLPPTPPLPRQP